MKLKDYKNKSHDYTAKASDIIRQLNFAGIGIIWIIKTTGNNQLELNDNLIFCPLILVSISLLLDLSQYVLGGILWMWFYRKKEEVGIDREADVTTTKWRGNILYTFYFTKLGVMAIAYVFIFKALLASF